MSTLVISLEYLGFKPIRDRSLFIVGGGGGGVGGEDFGGFA